MLYCSCQLPPVISQPNIRHPEEIYVLRLVPSAVFLQATVARKSKTLMSEALSPQSENRILAALSAEDYQRLSAHLLTESLALSVTCRFFQVGESQV